MTKRLTAELAPSDSIGSSRLGGLWRLCGWGLAVAAVLVLVPEVRAQQKVIIEPTRVPYQSVEAPPSPLLEVLLFYAVAGSTVFGALAVCFTKNIVRMAVWLLVTLVSVAMLYFLLAANFIAAVQLIVYAGGTLILLIFGVMLTSKSPWVKFEPSKVEVVYAAAVCGLLVAVLAFILTATIWPPAQEQLDATTVADLGRSLMTTYVVPFEVAGVLLMIVMVGAAHLARQEKQSP